MHSHAITIAVVSTAGGYRINCWLRTLDITLDWEYVHRVEMCFGCALRIHGRDFLWGHTNESAGPPVSAAASVCSVSLVIFGDIAQWWHVFHISPQALWSTGWRVGVVRDRNGRAWTQRDRQNLAVRNYVGILGSVYSVILAKQRITIIVIFFPDKTCRTMTLLSDQTYELLQKDKKKKNIYISKWKFPYMHFHWKGSGL